MRHGRLPEGASLLARILHEAFGYERRKHGIFGSILEARTRMDFSTIRPRPSRINFALQARTFRTSTTLASKFRAICGLVFFAVLLGSFSTLYALEEGEVTGEIERTNEKFLRDYQELDYKGQKAWEAWGRGLESLGWIVVRGDSGEMKDYILLVIDTRTVIAGAGSDKGRIADLRPGDRIRAKYRMGWAALHALEVKKLDE